MKTACFYFPLETSEELEEGQLFRLVRFEPYDSLGWLLFYPAEIFLLCIGPRMGGCIENEKNKSVEYNFRKVHTRPTRRRRIAYRISRHITCIVRIANSLELALHCHNTELCFLCERRLPFCFLPGLNSFRRYKIIWVRCKAKSTGRWLDTSRYVCIF